MIGKSYDGTLANGVAATGVDGPDHDRPDLARSRDWYDYSRMGGIRFNTQLPGTPRQHGHRRRPPRALRADRATAMNAADGDETGDINAFWTARDYRKDADNVKAVGVRHARPPGRQRQAEPLSASGGPASRRTTCRASCGCRAPGHIDPFDFRRADWVDTLHRWFDYWLHGVPNGIMSEPRVDIEHAADTWSTLRRLAAARTRRTSTSTCAARAAGAPGTLGAQLRRRHRHADVDRLANQCETTMINSPTGSQTNRRVFLSRRSRTTCALRHAGRRPPRVAGQDADEPRRAARRLRRRDAGLAHRRRHHRPPPRPDVLGRGERERRRVLLRGDQAAHERHVVAVTKGILDSSNRDSLLTPTLANIGETYRFEWPTLPVDVVFAGRPPDRHHPRRELLAVQRRSTAPPRPRSRSTRRPARSACRSSAATRPRSPPARSRPRPWRRC